MSWNYRVLKKKHADGCFYDIHEVYYDDEGRPMACTEQPVSPRGESIEELLNDIRHYAKALQKPVIDYDDITVSVEVK